MGDETALSRLGIVVAAVAVLVDGAVAGGDGDGVASDGVAGARYSHARSVMEHWEQIGRRSSHWPVR